jgi:hypothetical protein
VFRAIGFNASMDLDPIEPATAAVFDRAGVSLASQRSQRIVTYPRVD